MRRRRRRRRRGTEGGGGGGGGPQDEEEEGRRKMRRRRRSRGKEEEEKKADQKCGAYRGLGWALTFPHTQIEGCLGGWHAPAPARMIDTFPPEFSQVG